MLSLSNVRRAFFRAVAVLSGLACGHRGPLRAAVVALLIGVSLTAGRPVLAQPPAPTGLTAYDGHSQTRLTWNMSSGATSYNVYRATSPGGEGTTPYQSGLAATTYTDPGLTNGQKYYYQVAAVNGGGTGPKSIEIIGRPNIHVDSGAVAGSTYTDASGQFWTSDTGSSTGTTLSTANAITPATDQTLFQTQRVGASFSYSLPAVNGNYTLKLLFADIQSTGSNQNVFNVAAAGRTIITGLDIYAKAGGAYKQYVVSLPVKIGTNALSISVTATKGSGALAGFALLPPPPPSASNIAPPGYAEDALAWDSGTSGGSDAGPGSAMLVNVASLLPANAPGADIGAYNPLGPGAAYSRTYYGNLVATTGHTASPQMGNAIGWTDNYDLQVTAASPTAWSALTLRYPNDGKETITPTVSMGSATFTHPASAPYAVSGVPSGVTGQWTSLTLTFKDRTAYTFTPAAVNTTNTLYVLTQIKNLVGHYVTLQRDPANNYRINSIQDDATPTPNSLLQFNYSGANLISVQDVSSPNAAERRQVNFTFTGAGKLVSASQITSIGGGANTRWHYGYVTPVAGGPDYLHDSQTPSPLTGDGVTLGQFAAFSYDDTGVIRYSQDAVGRSKYYFPVNSGNTRVSVYDTAGNLALNWTQLIGAKNLNAGFNDANFYTQTHTFGDAANPYLPTAIKNRKNQQDDFTYDAYGNLLTAKTPRGVKVTNVYDPTFPQGQLQSTQLTHETGGSTDATRIPTTIAYFTSGALTGLVQSVTAPQPGATYPGSSVTSAYTYTPMTATTPGGNVATVTAPNANGTRTTAFNYTSWNPVPPNHSAFTQTEKAGQPLTVTVTGPDAAGGTTTQVAYCQYDGRGNVTATIDALGNETDYQYNLANQVTQVQQPATGETGAGRVTTINVYQYVGGPLKNVTLYDESGASVRQVKYTYNEEGQVLTVKGSVQPVTYIYDGVGRVSRLTDGNNHSTNYFYDNIGNLAQTQFPLYNSGTGFDSLTYTYDADQNLLTEKDGRGVTKTYARVDPESLVTGVTYTGVPAFVTAIPNVAFGYDVWGRLASRNDGVTGNATIPKTYTYDDLDDPLHITTNFVGGPQGQLISYSYNNDGSRHQMGSPSGTSGYEYDGVGRLTKAIFPWGPGNSVTHTYFGNGWLQQSNGVRTYTDYTYNNRGLLKTLTNTSQQPGFSGQVLSSFTGMTYDAAGNRRGLTASIPAVGSVPAISRTQTFAYDAANATPDLNRDVMLSEASAKQAGADPSNLFGLNYSNAFTLDGAFNLSTVRGSSVSHNFDNQRTTAGGGGSFGYDGSGNPTTYNGVAFAFDTEDRLTDFASPSFSARYDADGLRATRTTTSVGTLWFLYDEAGSATTPLTELTFSGGVTSVGAVTGVAGDGVRARYYPAGSNGSNYWVYLYDPQGNAIQKQGQTNSTYPVYSVASYEGYGLRSVELSTITGSGSPHRDAVGFGGQFGYYTDYDTGLLCLTHRYYDPATGRFVNRDPIGYDGGINLYTFAGGNPINGRDPLGLDYVGDVNKVFDGYLDAIWGTIRSPYDTAVFLGTYADNPKAGVSAVGQGISDWWGGLTGTDPRAFGNSFGTILITAVSVKAGGSLKVSGSGIANPLPSNGVFARVMPYRFAAALEEGTGALGGGSDAFIAAGSDLRRVTTVRGAAKRLTLLDNAGNLRLDGDAIVFFELEKLEGIASPINRPHRGFLHGGRTVGGAREFVVPSKTAVRVKSIRRLK